ncbi:MAG TPA: hypothetical protein DEP85_02690 [Holosporales bacterium]|nr:hypothetical protein [Holosporales bacterium]HCC24405.1 hypothetical protein [Holosporales bacterium]
MRPHFSRLERENSGFIAYNRFEAKNKPQPEVLFLGGFHSDMTGTKATYLVPERKPQVFAFEGREAKNFCLIFLFLTKSRRFF